MKRILGLDLGITSIGFAYVKEAENNNETSSIEKIGVRVNPLTTDEQTNFEKGKPLTTNADRTLKRGARRNLDRYQLRRTKLIEVLKAAKLISAATVLTESDKNTTFETWQLRAKAVTEKIEKEALARILLAINKKRGYKSSRKAKNEEEGQAIDGMNIAKKLHEQKLTPGQLAFQFLKEGKKLLPDFYRSDLQSEFDKVWHFQKQFYPELLTDNFYQELQGKGQRGTSTMFWIKYNFNIAEIKDIEDSLKNKNTVAHNFREKKKLQAYKWRSDAIAKPLTKEEVAYVITAINNDLSKSSGYLGGISDRSKELYFNKETVGEYLFKQLQENPHNQLKNKVFYRKDYLDEFEAIWKTQSKFYPVLTDTLKKEIQDTIFYQRKLKSQKGLISFCEFENKDLEIEKNGKKVKKTIGLRTSPKSSPLFQEFKIWQFLNNVQLHHKEEKTKRKLFDDEKELLFEELNLKGTLSSRKALHIIGNPKGYHFKYSENLEGNRTNKTLYEAYLKILETEGYTIKELLNVNADKDKLSLDDIDMKASEIKDRIRSIFNTLEINTEILDFNAELDGKDFEKQAFYQLWHLLYAVEDDNSPYTENDMLMYGNDTIGLKKQLCNKFGFKPEHARILVNNVSLQDGYGNLSAKALRKIYPYSKEHQYSDACKLAGYNHSEQSHTKAEIQNRELKPRLEPIQKNSLRNPVVEKILNQMINVVNTLIDREKEKDPDFYFDEIRIELARELKKNASKRAAMTFDINTAKTRHRKIVETLQKEFGIKNPTRNDVIRYKLYAELKNNGYKDLYTDTYIPKEKLFTKEIDIEHIIPQSKAFDDSFSNKTLSFRQDNLDKGNQTAYDYIESKFGDKGLNRFLERIEALYKIKQKNKDNPEEGISKAKFQKLQKREADIGDGFAERDLRDSQYIAKKAKNILFEITRSVVSTSGAITGRLREDWDLINIMKELNLPRYRALGLTEIQERKFGKKVEIIRDWTKRNDHRHHAMDALTVAFTRHNHIQYLNYLNARTDENHKLHKNIIAIETKETEVVRDENGNKKRKFKSPITNFRQEAKKHLERILVSHKAKNKVVTKNKNKTKCKNGEQVKIELTPRGQLHKETIYGSYHHHASKEEKVGTKFNRETIEKVSNPLFKNLLLQRLSENEDNPKKAFGGKNTLSKNPIHLPQGGGAILPEKVTLVSAKKQYSIRKEVTAENFKNFESLEKVIDEGVKRLLKKRLEDFEGNAKEAFSDIENNPIWLNKEKGIKIKRVRISGAKNVRPLHYRKDHLGHFILDKNKNKIPTDFVSTGNNHHIAIYRDEKGNLQENVVSFFEAVHRIHQGLPIIDKTYHQHLGWYFLFTMKQNEYFVFPNEETDFDPNTIDLLDPENKNLISPNLFRVQKISTKNYYFRQHLETNVDTTQHTKDTTWKREGLLGINGIVKVRINPIGDIVYTGEY